MRIFHLAAIAIASVSLAGCQTMMLGAAGPLLTAVPNNLSSVPYTNNQVFDEQLAGALAAGADEVRIDLAGSTTPTSQVLPIDSRTSLVSQVQQYSLVKWAAAAQAMAIKNGQMGGYYTCQVPEDTSESGIWDGIRNALNIALEVRRTALVRYIDGYNMFVYTTAEDTSVVDHVVFRKYSAGSSC